MAQDERRIRSLKLRGSDHTLLRQARYRLEEALRTTSLPGLPPNAQLLVRRLDLGSMPVTQTPSMLAGRITEMLRHMAATAVWVDRQPAPTADLVWFSDPLAPYRALLARLLDGEVAHEWYWRTLFPHQVLIPNAATIEMVLMHAARTELRGMATAALLQQSLVPRRLVRLLSFITEELALRMLCEQGLSPVAVPGAKAIARPELAADTTGVDNLQRLTAPNLSHAWRNALRQAAGYWGAKDVRTLWFAWHALVFHQPAWLERKDALQRIAPDDWLLSWARIAKAASDESDSDTVTEVPAGDRPARAFDPEASHARLPNREALTADADSASVANPHQQIKLSSPPQPIAADARHASEARMPQRRDEASGTGFPASEESPLAGFAFMIPLLQRIGMTELLARNEPLIALDLPRQLLWAQAQRFGMTERDPARLLFEGFEPCADLTIERLHAPDAWQRLATRSGRPLPGLDERAAPVRLDRLIKTMQLLLARYLRRHGGLALRSLLQRAGRVLLTATHWDVIFHINQTDLRLRRIALDADPGWVAWLGRVVQFHYDSEG